MTIVTDTQFVHAAAHRVAKEVQQELCGLEQQLRSSAGEADSLEYRGLLRQLVLLSQKFSSLTPFDDSTDSVSSTPSFSPASARDSLAGPLPEEVVLAEGGPGLGYHRMDENMTPTAQEVRGRAHFPAPSYMPPLQLSYMSGPSSLRSAPDAGVKFVTPPQPVLARVLSVPSFTQVDAMGRLSRVPSVPTRLTVRAATARVHASVPTHLTQPAATARVHAVCDHQFGHHMEPVRCDAPPTFASIYCTVSNRAGAGPGAVLGAGSPRWPTGAMRLVSCCSSPSF